MPVTFEAASSEALLSSPDIEMAMGSRSGAFYVLATTNATALARTVYWRASFATTPAGCEEPLTFTSPVHTLIVVPSEAELAAAEKNKEEAEAKKRTEEEAAAEKKRTEEVRVSRLSLAGIPQHNRVLGRRHAPVVMDFWGDPQSPYSRLFDRVVLPKLVARYVRSGKLQIRWRSFAVVGLESLEGEEFVFALACRTICGT